MRKQLLTFILFCLTLIISMVKVSAQVGIGTTSPNSSAVLDLSSSSKGLLIPRMTSSQRTSISSPAKGLMVFDNDSAYFFYYTGSAWQALKSSTATSNYWSRSGSNTALGNSSDNVGIGKTPSYKLDVNGIANADSFGIGGKTIVSTRGANNILIGYLSGTRNTGYSNSFAGYNSGYSNTSGYANSFFGQDAGHNNTTGYYNSYTGYQAGFGATSSSGSYNVFNGIQSGYNNSTGSDNIFIGSYSGYSNSSGNGNTFSGIQTGYYNTTGSYNSFTGTYAGASNTTGSYNAMTGFDAGGSNTTGSNNSFLGTEAGVFNSTGNNNTFTGYGSGLFNSSGSNNAYYGFSTGNWGTGSGNTASGAYAGYNSSGSHNTFIGDSADASTSSLSNATAIGYNAKVGQSNSIVLGNGANVGIGTSAPNTSAILELKSTTQGMLMPRMTSSQRTSISSPATGLMVFDTDSGYVFFYNSSWKGIKSTAATVSGLTNLWSRSGSSTTLANSSDNVGIGKSPSYKLDVKGMANADSFSIGGNTILSTKGTANVLIGQGTGTKNAYSYNTLIGYNSGFTNGGFANTMIGMYSGYYTTSGQDNQFIGFQAGLLNTTGMLNTFIGDEAGVSNTTGNNNICIGYQAGYANSTGSNNICMGYDAGASSTASYNIFFGINSGHSNTTGSANNFSGYYSGSSNTTGDHNVFLGNVSGQNNTTGNFNTFLGADVSTSNTTGSYNYFSGYKAGNNNSTGNGNTAVGIVAGYNSTGSHNTFLGDSADANTSGLDNAIALGYNAKVSASNSMVLGNGVNVGIGASSPQLPLDIQKPQTNLLRLVSTSGGSGNKALMSFATYGTGSTLNVSARIGAVDMGSNNGGLVFEVANNNTGSSTTTEAIRILNTGYVGLNTTSPNSMFEVFKGSLFSNGENYGLIVDESGSKRVGFMKYAGHEGGIWRTASQDFEIGRTSATSALPEGSVAGVTFTTDFYVGGSGNIGIGTGSPNATLDVRGSINTQRTSYSSSSTIASTDHICAVTTTSSITLTLPDASTAGAGREYVIKSEKSTATISIATSSSQTIDGASSKSISTGYGTIKVYSDGSNWFTF